MKISLWAASGASLAILVSMATLRPAGAVTQSACSLMPAVEASGILGNSVTTVDRPNPISAGSTTCVYLAAKRPIVQLAISVMQSHTEAEAEYKKMLQTTAGHPNVVSRQKGNLIISGITMNGDSTKLAALLDAALKNLQ